MQNLKFEKDNMIRLWLTFFVFAALIHFGIMSWRSMTGKDRWSLTKTMGYSIIVASLAFLVMIGIVIIF
jgi:hypothetical protein